MEESATGYRLQVKVVHDVPGSGVVVIIIVIIVVKVAILVPNHSLRGQGVLHPRV